jgi:glycosyltransferase involved in cell wall biosynthesis
LATLPPNFTLLQVVPDLDTGGAEQSTVDVAGAVARVGGRALVASRGGRMVERLRKAGGELFQFPAHTKNPIEIIKNGHALADVIRTQKIDIIHVRSRAPAFSAWIAARETGVPMVATYHGAYPARTPWKSWYNSIMTRGDLVIANSNFTRDHLFAHHRGVRRNKVIVIPRGIDLERFDAAAVAPARVEALRAAWRLDFDDRRTRILLPGRLTRLKGQLVLVEAAARLRDQGRDDFLILLVGDDQGRSAYRIEVEHAIHDAGLTDRIKLLGHCEDMPAAYLLSDLVAAPSTVAETFGRTAVEPQAMGVPVVASALGGLRETVIPGETGWLVAPDDPDALAQVLAEAIDAGPARRAAMGAAGRERVRKLYSVDAMTSATLDAYARVLEAKR